MKLNLNRHNQAKVREIATDAAIYLLARNKDARKLDDHDHDILKDIATRLLAKYFNGRALNLLTPEYVLAEIEDSVMARCEEIKDMSAFLKAAVQMAVDFDKFIKENDSEYDDEEE